MIAGESGRDAAIGARLAAEGCQIDFASEFYNPSLMETARQNGGQVHIVKDSCNPDHVQEVVDMVGPNLFLTNSDEALARGVVDMLQKNLPSLLIASPDKASARIEWDKFESRQIVAEIDQEFQKNYNPEHFLAHTPDEVKAAIMYFHDAGTEVVVKPRGLTGGKGVRVMGPHLADHTVAGRYALSVIEDQQQGGVSIEEKLEGQEFTIQGFTDGKTLIAPPATYDYPYREDGDTGPGTGGMGCFTMPAGEQLPFLKPSEYEESLWLMRQVLRKLAQRGHDYKGVLYGSFFKTLAGLKVVEFNARIGDPEGINIVELLDEKTALKDVLEKTAQGKLHDQDVRFKELASAVIYLVSPDYAYRTSRQYRFKVDPEMIAAHGCRAYFSAAHKNVVATNEYQTAGASRTLAVATLDTTPWGARARLHEAIRESVSGPLEFRQDIAAQTYIANLT